MYEPHFHIGDYIRWQGDGRVHDLRASPGWRVADDDVVVDPGSGAMKADRSKARVDLIPVAPLLDAAAVLEFGARKYAERNWELGFDWSRVYGAALRHLLAFWAGEEDDPETGLPHLAHALCCVMFLAEYGHTGAGRDDRPRATTGQEAE